MPYSKIIKVLAILALFTPLIISKSTLFPFIFGKAIAFQILVELMLIFYLVGLAKFPEWRPRFSLLMAALAAFFVVLVLSTVFGVDPYMSFWSKHERMEGLFTLSHYFVFFLVLTSVFRKKEDWTGFLKWSVIAAFLVALHASAQWLNLPGFVKGIGISATLGNSSFLATYLVFNSFFALFLFLNERKSQNIEISKTRKSRRPALAGAGGFYLACFLFFNFVLLLTGTRAALYGQFLGLFVFSGLYGFFLASPRLKKTIAAGLVLAVVFVSLIFVFKDSDFVKGSRILARVTDTSFKSATLQQRFAGWRTGIEAFKTRPLLGWGQENYYIVFHKFLDPYFYGPTETFDRPHNKYIDVLVSNGALGLLTYLAIFGVLFFWIWRNRPKFSFPAVFKNSSAASANSSVIPANSSVIPANSSVIPAKAGIQKNARRTPDDNFVPLWFFGLISAYLVQNTLLFDMPTSYPFFFLTLAFANFIFAGPSSAIASEARQSPKKILPVLAFVLIPALVFVLWRGNLKPYGESRLLIQTINAMPKDFAASFDYSRKLFKSPSFVKIEARNVIAQNLIDKGSQANLRENSTLMTYALFMVDELRKGVKESPLNFRHYGSLANLYGFLGQADSVYSKKSEETARLALEIFPRDISFLLKIFTLRFQADDLDGAEAALEELLAKAPNSHLGRWYLAMIRHKRQDFEAAKREAETALSLGYAYAGNLNNHNFLASIYFNLKDYGRALDYFMEAYEFFPKNPQLLADIAVTHYRLGDKDKAREWILKITEISPEAADEVNKFLRLVSD